MRRLSHLSSGGPSIPKNPWKQSSRGSIHLALRCPIGHDDPSSPEEASEGEPAGDPEASVPPLSRAEVKELMHLEEPGERQTE